MAARRLTIAFHVEPAFARKVKRRALAALARRVLASDGVAPAQLSVVVTDDGTVQELNRRYRGIDAATDVLSFSLESSGDFPTPPGRAAHLGEVVISYPMAARQARDAGHDVESELAHLLVHGVLHLLGYDHDSARDSRRMRAREEALLGAAVH